MASSQEFVSYAAEQMGGAGNITYRKMFGEYGIYCDGKIIGVICEDQLFLKITEGGRKLCREAEEAAPYEGAKPHLLIESLDDRAYMAELVRATYEELPEPKARKKSGKGEQKEPDREKAAKEQQKKPDKEKTAKERQKKPDREKAAKERQKKLDYKKAYKELYQPGKKPQMIDVPEMTFIQVEGKGNPNTSEDYKRAMEILYGLSFTIKMSKMSGKQPEGYFEYVVPPLEGLWWVEDETFDGKNITDKDRFCWISMIRQPEFVTDKVFEWAKGELRKKKPELDFTGVRLVRFTEGLCGQVMHVGPYDDEPETIEKLEQYIKESGYVSDLSDTRRHHEIYLGDPRRTKPENLKTVIRHPARCAD